MNVNNLLNKYDSYQVEQTLILDRTQGLVKITKSYYEEGTYKVLIEGEKVFRAYPWINEQTFIDSQVLKLKKCDDLIKITEIKNHVKSHYYIAKSNAQKNYICYSYQVRHLSEEEAKQKFSSLLSSFLFSHVMCAVYNRHGIAILGINQQSDPPVLVWQQSNEHQGQVFKCKFQAFNPITKTFISSNRENTLHLSYMADTKSYYLNGENAYRVFN